MSCLRSPNQLQGEDGRPWKSLADRNFTFASITGLVVGVDSRLPFVIVGSFLEDI
ncbi:hypothetical protein M758_2G143600 [Ceratodon purpureus]|nr:hypothetical protein M758_2G143600 [Ceratodon purpureus]